MSLIWGLIFSLIVIQPAYSALWSETSASLLHGNNHKGTADGNEFMTELNFHHASGFEYGDNFILLGIEDPLHGNTALYAEWSPRFSLGRMFGGANPENFIKDYYIATTFEMGSYDNSNAKVRDVLYGIGLDLNIPGAEFFQWNIYIRDNLDKDGTTFQSTFAYRFRFIASEKAQFYYAAYIDVVHGDEDNIKAYWHSGQQLMWDLGASFWRAKDLYLGMEFQYWDNKYAYAGEETNLKSIIRWVF